MMSKEKHPSLPLFLVGHSMGGMIALRCVIRSFISPPPYTIIVVQVVTNAFWHHFLKSWTQDYFFSKCFQSQEPRTFWRLCSERPFNSAWSSGSYTDYGVTLMTFMTMMTIMTMMTKMTLLTTMLKRNSTFQVGPLDLRSTPWRTYISRWERLLSEQILMCCGGENRKFLRKS